MKDYFGEPLECGDKVIVAFRIGNFYSTMHYGKGHIIKIYDLMADIELDDGDIVRKASSTVFKISGLKAKEATK